MFLLAPAAVSTSHSPPLCPKPARFLWSEAITLLTGARGLASFLIWVGSRLNMATFFTFLMGGGAVLPSSFATLSTLSSSGSVETSQSWTLSHSLQDKWWCVYLLQIRDGELNFEGWARAPSRSSSCHGSLWFRLQLRKGKTQNQNLLTRYNRYEHN